MAVTGFVTVQHVAFPSLRQRASLEPDGMAVFGAESTGDGSGGNVLITIRGDSSEFLYVLQTLTMRVNGSAANPGPLAAILNPEWVQDLQLHTEDYNVEMSVIMRETISTQWRADATHVDSFIRICKTMPTGKLEKLTTGVFTDLLRLNYPVNTNAAGYESAGTFYMYRREALTVPGFLEALVRPALVR